MNASRARWSRAFLLLPLLLFLLLACNGTFVFDPFVGEAPDAGLTSCTSDSTCHIAALHCDVDSGACVECTSSANCAAPTPVCAAGRCVACTSSADCSNAMVCDTASQTCLQHCHDTDDCRPPATTCDETRAVCVVCTSDSQCSGATSICSVAAGSCVQCNQDAQCPASAPLCDTDGACVACRSAGDCPAPSECDPAAHVCK